MNNDAYTIESGHLDVGDGHSIYYQRWGNPKAAPTLYLHGGPGAGCKDKLKALFDPAKHHVLFYDQRGSGQSTPFGSTEHNTTQKLIEDIEKLREKFSFEKVNIIGGSWGSTLALAYAIEHPTRVEKQLLWGIFTGRKQEVDYIQQGGLKSHYPEAWEQYIAVVPENFRQNTVAYYLDKMLNGTEEEQKEHVRRWVLNESAAATIDSDYETSLIISSEYDDTARTLALIEAHYFINNCFMAPDHILKNAHKLADIETVLVQGRFDHVCPPETAYALQKEIGKNCRLHMVPTSHARESGLREVVRAYAWSFLI